jgi:hypothetical protein
MVVCPVCKSDNLGRLQISSPDGHASAQLVAPGRYSARANIRVCLECGSVFVQLPENIGGTKDDK